MRGDQVLGNRKDKRRREPHPEGGGGETGGGEVEEGGGAREEEELEIVTLGPPTGSQPTKKARLN